MTGLSNKPVGGGTTTWDAVIYGLKKAILDENLSDRGEGSVRWAINIMEEYLGRKGGMTPKGWVEETDE